MLHFISSKMEALSKTLLGYVICHCANIYYTSFIKKLKPSMVVPAFKPSPQEAAAGRSPGLRKYQERQGCYSEKPFLKKQNKKTNNKRKLTKKLISG